MQSVTRFPKYKEFNKKLFTEYVKTHNINELMELFANFAEEHRGTLDGDIGSQWLGEWLMFFNQFDQMLEIFNRLEQSNDPFIRILVYADLVFYYFGWLHPPIDIEKAVKYYKMCKQEIESIKFEDDWERYYAFSIFLHAESILETDTEKRVELIENLRLNNSKLPEYGESYGNYQEIAFSQFFEQQGMFEEAKVAYSRSLKLGDTDLSVFGLTGMVNVSIITGEYAEAMDYSILNLERAIAGGNNFTIRMAYNIHAHALELNSEFEEAEEALLKAVEVTRQTDLQNLIFSDYNSLFSFSFRMYNLTKNQSYFEKSLEHRMTLLKLADENPNDQTMDRLSKRANAMILKMGGMRERVKAADIFEELIVLYPTGMDRFYQTADRTIELKIQLIEMYLHDLSNDILGETKKRIDELVEEISGSPLMSNPHTITEYSNFQILIAKYKFYVNRDIEGALKILYDLKPHAEKYGLKLVVEKITKEIQVLEREISKWRNIDLSTQERIKRSEIESYMEKAMSAMKKEITID